MNLLGVVFLVLPIALQAGYADTTEKGWQALFNADYRRAERLGRQAQALDPGNPAGYELGSTAILFQLRELVGSDGSREKSELRFENCRECQPLLREFELEERLGLQAARRRKASNNKDMDARFFLARLQLNRVWLNLQVLRKKSGWDEYWEAKNEIQAVLEQSPEHARGLTASAWIEYIVSKRNPIFRIILGGGSKEEAVARLRKAVMAAETTPSAKAEAQFGLMEMLSNEGAHAEAMHLAEALCAKFPGNRDVCAAASNKGQ